jgi:hypothetical protein
VGTGGVTGASDGGSQRALRRRLLLISLRWALIRLALFAAFSTASAMVALLAALLLDHFLPGLGGIVYPLLLAVLGAGAGYLLVVKPVFRGFGVVRQAVRIEEATGARGCILPAAELVRRQQLGAPSAESADLVVLAASRGLGFLDSLKPWELYPLKHLVALAWVNLGLAVALTGAVTLSDRARVAIVSLFAGEEQASTQKNPPPWQALPPRPLHNPLPACLKLDVTVLDPRYLGASSRIVPLNGHLSLLAGSTLRFSCLAPARSPRVMIDRKREDGSRLAQPMLRVETLGDEALFTSELTFGEAEELRLYRELDLAGSRLWHQGVWVLHPVKDLAPECWLSRPDGGGQLREGQQLTISLDAKDDWGLSRVVLKYRVPEIEEEFLEMELAASLSGRELRLEDRVSVDSLGAEPGQSVELQVEVFDIHEPGPGVCRTEKRVLLVQGGQDSAETLVEAVAALRDACLDLLARVLHLPPTGSLLRTLAQIYVGEEMEQLTLGARSTVERLVASARVEQEELTRLAQLAARLEELLGQRRGCWYAMGRRLRACVEENTTALVAELTSDVPIVTDSFDSMLGSHLVGRIQQLEVLRRELSSIMLKPDTGTRRQKEAQRQVSRLIYHGKALGALEARLRTAVPEELTWPTALVATASAGTVASLLGHLEQLKGSLGATGDRSARMKGLDQVGRAMDELSRSAEGDYFRTMSRSLKGFQRRLSALRLEYLKLGDGVRGVQKQLALFTASWEKRLEQSFKGRLLRRWREVRRVLRITSYEGASLDEQAYLPLERQGVVEQKKHLRLLAEAFQAGRLEDALGLLADAEEQLQSMRYSLELSLRYSDQGRDRIRAELGRIRGLQRNVELLRRETSGMVPLRRSMLKGPDRELLAGLGTAGLDLQELARKLDLRLDEMEAMYPALFVRLEQLFTQTRKALGEWGPMLDQLDLEGARGLVAYALDTLTEALAVMDEASKGGRRGGLVIAGGGGLGGKEVFTKGGELPLSRVTEMLQTLGTRGLTPVMEQVARDYYRRLLK